MKNYRSHNRNKEEVRVVVSDPSLLSQIALCLRENRIWTFDDPQSIELNNPEAVGGFITISGSAGCGKSTLADLFCNEIDLHGQILVNSDDHPPKNKALFLGIQLDKIKEKIAVRLYTAKPEIVTPVTEVFCKTEEVVAAAHKYVDSASGESFEIGGE